MRSSIIKQTPLLIVFLGFPGSGKTHFARQLAKKIQAVTLNSDALRLSMFRSLENIEHLRETERSRLYDDVFGAMDYAAKQILTVGYSVVYDAQQSKRRDRKNIEKIAHSVGAIPILVWVKTNPYVALRRGQKREARNDSHVYTAAKMKMLVDRFNRATDLPEAGENVIEFSGEVPFKQQYAFFEQRLHEIHEGLNDNTAHHER